MFLGFATGISLILSLLPLADFKDTSKRSIRIVPVLLLHILATRASRIEKSSASLLGCPTCNPRYLVSFSSRTSIVPFNQARMFIGT